LRRRYAVNTKHFLKTIDIAGRDIALCKIPDFDFYALSRIIRVDIKWTGQYPDDQDLSLVMTGVYGQGGDGYEVSFRFEGIRQLCLPELHDRGLFLSELAIEDVSAEQLEGVRFRVVNHESGEFVLLCAGIEVIACDSLEH
jgi:hypothetical protein